MGATAASTRVKASPAQYGPSAASCSVRVSRSARIDFGEASDLGFVLGGLDLPALGEQARCEADPHPLAGAVERVAGEQ